MAGRRLTALALLALAVLLLHLLATHELSQRLAMQMRAAAAAPPLEVSFVRELLPSAADPTSAPLAALHGERLRRTPRLAAQPAAVPAQTASAPAPGERVEAAAPTQPSASQPHPAQMAAASDVPDTATGSAQVFVLPPSTRLDYRLQGWWRGEVQGQAKVEWRRSGERYQVEMEVTIGPAFAPVATRRIRSDGRIGDDGLEPERYVDDMQALLGRPRQLVLPLGELRAATPGLQDSASQLVQLLWLLNLEPQRLQVGSRIELPLAQPTRVVSWRYDVVAQQALQTPLGEIDAMLLRPSPGQARPGELVVELWMAPRLQHLPVRMTIRHGAATYADLLLERAPRQALEEENAPAAR